ncbi:MAG: amino acid ABC transporter substrate-binding protein [Pseudomonadota bacterium]
MKGTRSATVVWISFIAVFMCLTMLCVPPSMAADEITVGFSMSLTGVYAAAALGQMQAYQLWEDRVNKAGGIKVGDKQRPIKLVYYDDKSQAATAVKVYEKLITQDKVDVLLSPNSTSIHFAVAPLAEKYKVPLVGSAAASVKLRDIKTNYFWFITACLPDRQMKALVDLLQSLKVKDVAIIYVQDLFPRENLEFLKPYLEKAGINIVLLKDYPLGAKDLTTLLSEAKSKKPQALIALCYAADSFTITTQVQEVGFNPDFFFGLVGPATVVYGPKFKEATEGIATMGHWSEKAKWPGAKEFFDAYVAKWGKKPDPLNSVLAYTACQIVQQAVEKTGGTDPKKLRDCIAGNTFETINGPIKFSGLENLETPSMILQWQKGSLEIVWPESAATAKPLFPKPKWPTK